MCASFTFRLNAETLMKQIGDFSLDPAAPFEKVQEDLYPFKYAHVFIADQGQLVLTAKRYSLTPSWSKDEKVKWATYNARLSRENPKTKQTEYIYQVPTWKGAFGRRHCLVPMSEFRESCHEGKGAGNIVSFTPPDETILFAAGIHEDWVNSSTGEIISTFAIITTDPDDFIKGVGHDRSPVFLDSEMAMKWLGPFKNGVAAYDFLERYKISPELGYEKVRALKQTQTSLNLNPE